MRSNMTRQADSACQSFMVTLWVRTQWVLQVQGQQDPPGRDERQVVWWKNDEVFGVWRKTIKTTTKTTTQFLSDTRVR